MREPRDAATGMLILLGFCAAVLLISLQVAAWFFD